MNLYHIHKYINTYIYIKKLGYNILYRLFLFLFFYLFYFFFFFLFNADYFICVALLTKKNLFIYFIY